MEEGKHITILANHRSLTMRSSERTGDLALWVTPRLDTLQTNLELESVL